MKKNKEGFVLLDPQKYRLVYQRFEDYLNELLPKNAKRWSEEANPKLQEKSAKRLDEALRRIGGDIEFKHIELDSSNYEDAGSGQNHMDDRALAERNRQLKELERLLKDCPEPPPVSTENITSLKKKKGGEQLSTGETADDNSVSDTPGASLPTGAATLAAGVDGKKRGLFEYRQDWLVIFRALRHTKGAEVHKHDGSIQRRIQKLEKFRFDRFVSPSIQWRRGAPTMGRNQSLNDDDWTTVDEHDWDNTASFLLKKLRKAQLSIMHDDAGMGKSAFSWMLFHSILNAKSETALAVRIEGYWPHRKSSDGSNIPLTLREILVEELLGYRENGIPIQGNTLGDDGRRTASDESDARRTANKELNLLAGQGTVYILLDGLDQMRPTDRKAALKALRLSLDRQDGIGNCHWLVSGRTYAFRIADRSTNGQQPLFDSQSLRFRLKKFDEQRQRQYFADLENDPFFRHEQVAPLDYLCSGWKKEATAEDLGIPLHLSEIRRVIEYAKGPDGKGPVQEKMLRVIHCSSDLHARVSDVYLRRAIQYSKIPSNKGPATTSDKIHVLRHICGVLAMQMMLDGNFNASIDATTNILESYQGVFRNRIVAAYLDRCKKRYKQSLNGCNSYWKWGVNVLQQIEVTHRGDIDIFQDECRSFRDTKAMEWYAAFYLANYATQADWNNGVSDAGQNKIQDFIGHENWRRCWRLAMELPEGYYDESHLENAIENILATPTHEASRSRKCEWMWIAWQLRLEQSHKAKQRRIAPLNRATTVIENFRKEFSGLVASRHPIALTLQFNAYRDSPDFTLENPNHTEMGWYRRIPDQGDFSMFRGEKRPDVVTVSPFWLRKFVVTNEEYRLFDPEHRVDKKYFRRGDLPVTEVDWYMATMFCRWLGPDYRLPTEAEWESACRANRITDGELQVETDFWFGNKKKEASQHMWSVGNSESIPRSLAKSQQANGHENRWGLFDMHGNVWEWCSDWFGKYPTSALVDPVGPATGSYRVKRGGSVNRGGKYGNYSERCRSADRNYSSPDYRDNNLGFRLALSSNGIPKSPEADK